MVPFRQKVFLVLDYIPRLIFFCICFFYRLEKQSVMWHSCIMSCFLLLRRKSIFHVLLLDNCLLIDWKLLQQ